MNPEDGPGPSKQPKLDNTVSTGDCSTVYYSTINFTTLVLQTKTGEEALRFCQHYGLIPKTVQCSKCESVLDKITFQDATLLFRCRKRACRASVSAKKNTWFQDSKSSLRKSLTLICFCTKQTTKQQSMKHLALTLAIKPQAARQLVIFFLTAVRCAFTVY